MSEDKTPPDELASTRADDGLRPTETARPASASRQQATPIPESIGNYRILGKLGEGGMGVVYEAQQQHPNRKVALKVIRGGQFVDEHRVKLFQREADTLARLSIPTSALSTSRVAPTRASTSSPWSSSAARGWPTI